MFSHSNASQESQVAAKRRLIDGVLLPHHFPFTRQNNEEEHVRAAEWILGDEMLERGK